ncbi:MAG: hypothetical protein HC919_13035, partial [Oscillatoriales cyanobacterium SM2_2_1]|nr:hypothetical protein [Oscillatoriales cyanobacterium SM2_2_1]
MVSPVPPCGRASRTLAMVPAMALGFLNVHEGVNGISRRVQTGFEPGMITSIEPGYYQP